MKNRTVLIIEDEPPIAEVVAMQLRRSGIDPIVASDAREGLSILAERTVDAIVADVALPGLSGVELARLLSEEPNQRRTPIVLLTGTSTGVSPSEIAGTRVVAVMLKPFSPKQLLQTVRMAIASGAGEPSSGASASARSAASAPVALRSVA